MQDTGRVLAESPLPAIVLYLFLPLSVLPTPLELSERRTNGRKAEAGKIFSNLELAVASGLSGISACRIPSSVFRSPTPIR